MKELYKSIIVAGNFATPAGEKLYQSAKSWLGKDASPQDNAPDAYGCAETVNNIVYETFGDYVGGDVSTYRMYKSLQHNPNFVQVKSPIQGDIILSPTGYGNGNISNGHVGIMGAEHIVMSNSSATGLFTENFTLSSWIDRYTKKGGFPTLYYRRLFIS